MAVSRLLRGPKTNITEWQYTLFKARSGWLNLIMKNMFVFFLKFRFFSYSVPEYFAPLKRCEYKLWPPIGATTNVRHRRLAHVSAKHSKSIA